VDFLGHGAVLTYRPWHDKITGKTSLRPDDGKCLHYYFYFIDEELGLCYVRVPTWCPFRLQVYLNGHHRLACRLKRKQIVHTRLDNALVETEDFDRTQKIADDWPVEKLHGKLNEWAGRYCPVDPAVPGGLPLEPGSSRVLH